ncbi:MAG: helix-turn-helix domain-containing protein [Victivallales bacterium]
MKVNKMPTDVLLLVHGTLQRYAPNLTPESLIDAIGKYETGNSQPVKPDKLYSQNETCDMYQFTRPTLLKLRKSGRLHGIKVGSRKIMFSHSELERFKMENAEIGGDGCDK